MEEAVATAVVFVALHVMALSCSCLCRCGVFIMPIGNSVAIRTMEVRIVR